MKRKEKGGKIKEKGRETKTKIWFHLVRGPRACSQRFSSVGKPLRNICRASPVSLGHWEFRSLGVLPVK